MVDVAEVLASTDTFPVLLIVTRSTAPVVPKGVVPKVIEPSVLVDDQFEEAVPAINDPAARKLVVAVVPWSPPNVILPI